MHFPVFFFFSHFPSYHTLCCLPSFLSLFPSILIEINILYSTFLCIHPHINPFPCHPSICGIFSNSVFFFCCFLVFFSSSLSFLFLLVFYFRSGMPTCLLPRVPARCILSSQTCRRSTTCTASASLLFCAFSKGLFRPRR